jgi:hypothetical protein
MQSALLAGPLLVVLTLQVRKVDARAANRFRKPLTDDADGFGVSSRYKGKDPRRFRSDTAYRFQLVRRTRALADVNAGLRYDHRSNKVRRVSMTYIAKTTSIT